MDIDSLIKKYVAGTLSDSEFGELSLYIRENDTHKQHFQQKVNEWEVLQCNSEEIPEWKIVKGKMKGRNRSLLKPLRVWGTVAAAIVVLIGISLYFGNSGEVEKQIIVNVPYGQVQNIILPDQSEVLLNAGSVLTYSSDFGQTNREVELKGEGFFVVRKHEGKRFIVRSGGVEAVVLGTRFNFNSFGEKEQVAVTLCSGSLKLQAGEEEMLIVPGEQLCYDGSRMTKQMVDTLNYCMWRQGCLMFQAETLERVAAKLERKFGVPVRILSPEIRSVSFSGLFKEDATLEYIMRVLKVGSPIPIEIEQAADQIRISVQK